MIPAAIHAGAPVAGAPVRIGRQARARVAAGAADAFGRKRSKAARETG